MLAFRIDDAQNRCEESIMRVPTTIPEPAAKILSQFDIQDDKLKKISDMMLDEFRLGLEKGRPESSVAMIPTFLPELPEKSETGKFVAIDLSGKNLRMMLLTLPGNGKAPETANHNFMIHQDVMTGTGDQLFNFIVNCLAKFLKEHDLEESDIPIGFVFSYPCELSSIRSARLLWWTKGFNVQDCLQQDVVKLLEDALELNMTIKARVKAVMNDTVGQLAASAYTHGKDCVIGVVIGYGCNASYLEDVSKITKFDAAASGYNFTHMVVDTEWEEFGIKGELNDILTSFDKEIDEGSVHKGKQVVDKLTGALYLGELVRRITDQMVLDGHMFGGTPVEALQLPDSFPTKYISEILSDSEVTHHQRTRRILDEIAVPLHGSVDYLILREICYAVSRRSAAITAAAIAALLKHLERPKVLIGVGGALVQFHPIYMDLLREKLSIVAPEGVEWEIREEGSGIGAALVAAVAHKLKL